jgi:hypothetical protein
MRIFLQGDQSDLTSEDFDQGEVIRGHFCSMFALTLLGVAEGFLTATIEAAILEEIAASSKLIPLIASLPSVYATNIARTKKREKLEQLASMSTKLAGTVGDRVQLTVTIIDSIYKRKFGTYAVNGQVIGTGQMIFFFERNKFEEGQQIIIAGSIKSFNGNTTQLAYVHKIKEQP